MQKVSKQSLAMLALSILLAISIALTFTFATLSNTKTATGTITFTGEVGLVFSGITDTDNFAFDLTVDGNGNITIADTNTNATDYNAATVKLAPTSMPANVAVTIAYTDTSSTLNKYVKLKAATGLTLDNLALSTDAYWTPESAGVKLADVVSLEKITDADDLVALSNVATLKFTVTFTASEVTGA